ncbi:MAG: hypothetical protein N2Z69_01055 [Methylophilaceae bacterium]|nr:hypothetical protein [Methylophilaceae bacterium]
MHVHAGEIWGKRQAGGNVVAYLVLKVGHKGRLTLRNLKTPANVFETDAANLVGGGYFRISATPYVDLTSRCGKGARRTRPMRCPRTVDMFEGRADAELPRCVD